MRFVELVIQGIRRFTDTQRLSFDENHTWIAAGTGGGKSTVTELVRACLEQGYLPAIEDTLVPWRPTQETARWALNIEGEAGRFRLLADARTGGVVLAQQDPASGKFQAVAQDAVKIRDELTDRFDFPDPADWRAVYLWEQGGGEAPPGGGPADGLAVEDAGESLNDAPEIQQKLEELEAERFLMESMDKVQFEMDGVADERFQLEDELKQLDAKLDKLAELDEELERTAAIADMDEELYETAQNFQSLNRRYHNEVREREAVVEERAAAAAELEAKKTWHRDPVFLAIVIGSLLAFIVPTVLKIYTLTLLGFAGLLVGVPIMAWRYKQHGDRLARAKGDLAEAEHELNHYRDHQQDLFQQVQDLVQEVQVLDAADLAKLYEKRAKMQEVRKKRAQQIADEGIEEERQRLAGRMEEVEARLAKLQKSVEEASAAQRDKREIDEEIQSLRRRLELIQAGEAPVETAPAAGGGGPALSPNERIAAIVDAGPRLARRDLVDFTEAISPLVTKIVSAVYPDRFKAVNIDPDGSATYIDAARNEPVEAREIHRGIELTTAAAVAVATAKLAARVRSFPLVWDEPFAELDDATLGRLGQVLAKATGELQVVVLSGRKALGSAFGQPQQVA